MSSGNSWLGRQRKSDLVDLAQALGLKDYDGYRKTDLELAIDEELSEHAARYQLDPRFQDYFKSRARAGGSPIKKEAAPEMKVSRRRAPKPVEEPVEDEPSEEEEEDSDSASLTAQAATTVAHAASTALARTPARALSLAERLQLPATPADVAQAVDRSTLAVREHISTLYHDSGITEATHTTRAWLSTVHSVLSAVALFELYYLRHEVLPDRYAFTVPAVRLLGTRDHAVQLPDMFALLTVGFWGPVLTWVFTSVLVPGVVGFFFNLSAGVAAQQHSSGRGRRSAASQQQAEYVVDPVMFSIVKAVVTYVVYAQGVTFGGLIRPEWTTRIDEALYSGWRGVLVGTAVSGLTAVYDAVLRK